MVRKTENYGQCERKNVGSEIWRETLKTCKKEIVTVGPGLWRQK